jgi:CBS domain-containing protein
VLIKDLMRRNVGAVQPATSLAIAARRMRDEDVGCLPVLDGGRLLGLITDRDIVIRAVAADVDVGRATVRDAMSAGAVFCFADQSADEVQQLMLDHQVNRLPVLDRRNRLVGLLSLGDIAGHRPKCRPHEVRFYKTMRTSSGHARDIAVATVYLSPAVRKEDLAAAAIRRFEQDRGGSPWGQHADGYEVVEQA